MNSLSLVLYFAGIVDGIKLNFGMIAFISMLLLIPGGCIAYFASRFSEYDGYDKTKGPGLWVIIVPTILFIVTGSISILVPDKDTIYLIAGSEIGEQVVKSPEAQEMLQDIREVIKQQLTKLKEDK